MGTAVNTDARVDKELSQLMIDYKSRSEVSPFVQIYLETGINPFIAVFLSKIKIDNGPWSNGQGTRLISEKV